MGASFLAEDITSLEDRLAASLVRGVPVEIASLSRHDIGNALAALAMSPTRWASPVADAAQALKAAMSPPPMRMEIVKTPSGDVTVLNDAYNAAPASVQSALETLAAYPGSRKIAFLGDMRELGARADEAHRELGGVITASRRLRRLCIPSAASPRRFPKAAQRFADSEDAARFVREALSHPSPGDCGFGQRLSRCGNGEDRGGFGSPRNSGAEP